MKRSRLAPRHMLFSCTACLRTAAWKSRTPSWIATVPWSSTRPKAACMCRRPSCYYCLAARWAARIRGMRMPERVSEKVVLAYSGGLDTSIIIPWLKENYAYDVIAMVGDVGQGDDIEAVVEKAYKTGASKVVVEDMREEFLTGYVFPALRAGAVYEHKYLLATS